MIKKYFMFGICILSIVACEKVTLEPGAIDPSTPLSFSTNIQPIFDNKCASCHGGNLDLNLKAGSSYQSLLDEECISTNPDQAENALLYTKIIGGAHGGATELETQMVLYWLQQGAKNN